MGELAREALPPGSKHWSSLAVAAENDGVTRIDVMSDERKSIRHAPSQPARVRSSGGLASSVELPRYASKIADSKSRTRRILDGVLCRRWLCVRHLEAVQMGNRGRDFRVFVQSLVRLASMRNASSRANRRGRENDRIRHDMPKRSVPDWAAWWKEVLRRVDASESGRVRLTIEEILRWLTLPSSRDG